MVGGESNAKTVSVSKLWLFTTNARGGRLLFTRPLLNFSKNSRPEIYVPNAFEQIIQYHVAEAGDIIVQPAFAVHAVITTPEVNRRRKCWSRVTGFEAVDVRMEFRDRRVTNFFRTVIKVAKEIQLHGRACLLRLFKIRDYRAAVEKCKENSSLDFQYYYAEAPLKRK